MHWPALRALLAAVAEETGGREAALCIRGTRLLWPGDAWESTSGPVRLECLRHCPLRAGGADRPGLLRVPLPGGAGANLCVSAAVRPLSSDRTLDALGALAAAQVSLHERLADAAVLARETDHRVRNALQSIASYLRLQETRAADADARGALAAAGRQVRAVALLHDEIGRAGDGAMVRVDRYLARLSEHLAAIAPEGVRIEVEVVPAMLTADKAATLAIIVNEFVTNSGKHAFVGTGGTVRLEGSIGADGRMALVLSDDGTGIREPPAGGGLGLRIVEAAIRKLDARQECARIPGRGHRLALSFPVEPVEVAA